MPEFNLIQRPDLILRLQQFLGIRQAHITPTIAEQVQAVVILGDVREPGLQRGQIRECFHYIAVPIGVAANPATVQLSNRAGSAVIITVDSIILSGVTAAVQYTFNGDINSGPELASGALNPPAFRDTSFADANRIPVGRLTYDVTTTPGVSTQLAIRHGIGNMAQYDRKIVLMPGFYMRFAITALLSGFDCSVSWTEQDVVQR